ncbi:uncharacterized protein M6B38_383525 [Iris pallida]|uniref:CCHC-type domain-containing protein n=1 Tax=Iris pallida TaxID=29817 RepID=A0AAX6FI24_IRIPA|nr:uncharacterized protein M6B38_417955 [Iris pallida]KAJ6823553.1 uncharacterized protein M6B38_383525 [Iris pallida]
MMASGLKVQHNPLCEEEIVCHNCRRSGRITKYCPTTTKEKNCYVRQTKKDRHLTSMLLRAYGMEVKQAIQKKKRDLV